MDELITWLRQQLDEEERVARGATCGGTPWRIDGMSIVGRSWRASPASAETLVVKHTWPQEAAHIVRWDPARVLAEVEAKRRILDDYGMVLRQQSENSAKFVAMTDGRPSNEANYVGVKTQGWKIEGRLEGLRAAIERIAQPYAGRPGWREEWAA